MKDPSSREEKRNSQKEPSQLKSHVTLDVGLYKKDSQEDKESFTLSLTVFRNAVVSLITKSLANVPFGFLDLCCIT